MVGMRFQLNLMYKPLTILYIVYFHTLGKHAKYHDIVFFDDFKFFRENQLKIDCIQSSPIIANLFKILPHFTTLRKSKIVCDYVRL